MADVDRPIPHFQPGFNLIDGQLLNVIVDVCNEMYARTSIAVGDYLIFQDADGSLKIRAPDNSVVPLVTKT